MTTPSKAVRPCIAYEANDCGYYSQSEADAIFECLEAELRDTRRALYKEIRRTLFSSNLFEPDFTDEEYERCVSKAFEERIEAARKERGQ
jgi:hypothetical protein